MAENPIGLPTHYGAPIEWYAGVDDSFEHDVYALSVYFTSAEDRKAFALAVRQAIKKRGVCSVGIMSRTGADVKPERRQQKRPPLQNVPAPTGERGETVRKAMHTRRCTW